MSLGNITNTENLGEQFKGLTFEECKQKIEETFYTQYGRYESTSGKMYFELEHNGADDDHKQGSVKWRKGITNGAILENEVLEREQAIRRFLDLIPKGYERVFQATTAADFERETAKQLATYSPMKQEGLLGSYIRGDKDIFRIDEYNNLYSIEYLYDGMTIKGEHELDEATARGCLAKALGDGFHREDADIVETEANPFAAWQVDNIIDEDAERDSGIEKDVPNMSALLKAFGD